MWKMIENIENNSKAIGTWCYARRYISDIYNSYWECWENNNASLRAYLKYQFKSPCIPFYI